ncbi:hypothetical protein CERSUDRAFT_82757 [Gelatoporia subvermispora B]|uniref:Zinc-ribbon 15 domain-containing protein n=1 Tax=Ceriporiopsis subvermispora (strain B) TaxID=914234 RepID=M2RJ62_CERS8|nr:hypothetical protein CERSUDRAFT_82757 [Gelatoporia subvermispora B]
MDFLFCIPIVFGCPTKIKPEGDQSPRICPRCHNASVCSAKSRTWFELCWVPLVPMRSKHIWICSICQWSLPKQVGQQQNWEPAMPGYHSQPGGQGVWQSDPTPSHPPSNYQPGYQPAYTKPN